MAQAGGKSIRKGATNLRVGRRQPSAPIAEPDASCLAQTDSHSEAGGRIERAGGKCANHWDQFEDFPKSEAQRPPSQCTASDGPGELAERCSRPGEIVADRKCTQHEREYAREATHTDQGERSCACACRSCAIAVDEGTRFRAYVIALGIGPRSVQCFER